MTWHVTFLSTCAVQTWSDRDISISTSASFAWKLWTLIFPLLIRYTPGVYDTGTNARCCFIIQFPDVSLFGVMPLGVWDFSISLRLPPVFIVSSSPSLPPLHPSCFHFTNVLFSSVWCLLQSISWIHFFSTLSFWLLFKSRDTFSHFLIFPTVSSFSPYILVAICVCDVIYPGDETRDPSTTAKGFNVSIAYCFDLNEDCFLQAHMFAYWFLTWCCGTLRRWTLMGEAGS